MSSVKKIVPLFLLIACLGSCKDESVQPASPEMLYSYFPVNVGHEVIYNVELITKDEFSGAQDTAIYQLKEVIESEFTDIQGRLTQRLERYTRTDSTQAWTIADVWTSNLLSGRAEKKEENNTYVKLTFPVTLNKSWNGNAYNNLTAQSYKYTSVNEPLFIGGSIFDSTLTVLQDDYEDFLEKSFKEEQYATGIGLIYKEDIYIKKDYLNPGSLKSQRKYKQTFVSSSN